MYVRLSVPWTDPMGAVHAVGDVVDVNAVTLAEMEEQGVVDIDATASSGGTTSSTPSPTPVKPVTDPNTGKTRIGPGPGTPPKDSTGTD